MNQVFVNNILSTCVRTEEARECLELVAYVTSIDILTRG